MKSVRREGLEVRWGIYRDGPSGLEEVGAIASEESPFLLVEAIAARAVKGTLSVELHRGQEPRDRWDEDLSISEGGTWSRGFALRFRGQGIRSSRMSVRLFFDGTQLDCAQFLVGVPAADAQGRFPDDTGRPASDPTLVEFRHQFQRLLQRGIPEENGRNGRST